MASASRWHSCAISILLLLSASEVGCRHGARVPPKVESNLKVLAVFYGRYVTQHRGQAPPDADAFRKFIEALPQGELAAMHVTDVGSIFTSPRDGQPYVVRYGVAQQGPSPTGAPPVAYEQTGVGGRRCVAFALGQVEEVDERRFKQLVPDR